MVTDLTEDASSDNEQDLLLKNEASLQAKAEQTSSKTLSSLDEAGLSGKIEQQIINLDSVKEALLSDESTLEEKTKQYGTWLHKNLIFFFLILHFFKEYSKYCKFSQ